jgi:hypothetical protein
MLKHTLLAYLIPFWPHFFNTLFFDTSTSSFVTNVMPRFTTSPDVTSPSLSAAKLADAEAPMQQQAFLDKQRELFHEQRKHQAEAMEYLHQYRADDEIIFKTTRHDSRGRSMGSTITAVTPDAECSYSSKHITELPFHVPEGNDSSPLLPSSKLPSDKLHNHHHHHHHHHTSVDVERTALRYDYESPDSTSPDYESIRTSLEAMAATASTLPLPMSMSFDNHDDCTPFMMFQGPSVDDGHLQQPATTITNIPISNIQDIPFESFLRLGASQIVDIPLHHAAAKGLRGSLTYYGGHSDSDDCNIPIPPCMNLGARLRADAMSVSKGENDGKDNFKEEVEVDTTPTTGTGTSHLLHDSVVSQKYPVNKVPTKNIHTVLQNIYQQTINATGEQAAVDVDHNKNPVSATISADITKVSETQTIIANANTNNDFRLENVLEIANANVSNIGSNPSGNETPDVCKQLENAETNLLCELPDVVGPNATMNQVENSAEYVICKELPTASPSDLKKNDITSSSSSMVKDQIDVTKNPTDCLLMISQAHEMEDIFTVRSEINDTNFESGDGVQRSVDPEVVPQTRRRKTKVKRRGLGYYPTSSRFVTRHYFSR